MKEDLKQLFEQLLINTRKAVAGLEEQEKAGTLGLSERGLLADLRKILADWDADLEKAGRA